MKAAVYYQNGPSDVFRYEEVDNPECLDHEVCIDIKVISVEGGDLLNRARGTLTALPHIVGYQAAGTITQVGSTVQGLQVGDRVISIDMYGSYAEKRTAPAQTVWKIPDTLSMEAAACIPVAFGTAHDCLFEFGRLKAGEHVLIQGGAGGVGLAAIQMAKRAGAVVYTTASSDLKLQRLISEYDVDYGINYVKTDLVQEITSATQGRGVNLVIDPVAGKVLNQSVRCLGYRGRVIIVGNADRDSSLIDAFALTALNQSIQGVFLGAEMNTDRGKQMIQQCIDRVASGELNAVIDKTFSLSDAAKAHSYVESRRAFGRVLLVP
jgi:NADPH:quinone reductase